MLYQRYGNPEALLQHYVEIKQLTRFISEVIELIADEITEKTQWEFYLHKVFDQTFDEFLRDVKRNNSDDQTETADMDEIETTVKRSLQLLDLFDVE